MKVAPAGKELVKEVVHEIDRLATVVGEKEAVVRRRREELAKAEVDLAAAQREHAAADAKLEALLRGAVCGPVNGCTHEHVNGAHPPKTNGVANGVHAKPKAKFAALEDKEKKIVWRIAFQLLDDPFLDYAEYGKRIWGEDVPFKTVKNRLSSNLAYLCKDEIGVAKALGSNKFQIDPVKLAEKSGYPVEAAP